MVKQNRRRVRKETSPRKRSRPAAARKLGHERPTRKEHAAIVEGRRAYARGDYVVFNGEQRRLIESRPGVLAGEPVIKGTRIPARLIADLVRQGVSRRTIRNEYDLTREQIDAVILFDRVTRRRPPVRRLHVKKHVPACR